MDILASLFLISGLVCFTMARRFAWDRAVLLDAATLTVGVAVLVRVYVISPTDHAGALFTLGRCVAVAYPCLGLPTWRC